MFTPFRRKVARASRTERKVAGGHRALRAEHAFMPRTFFILALTALAALARTPAPAPDVAPANLPAERTPPAPPKNPALPSIFIAGDSTADVGHGEHQQGWGVPFANYFDPAKVNIVNRARSGRSSRTFITQGWWEKLLADLKAGDIVLIQFGHNDSSPINEDASVPRQQMRSRGTIRGLGDETKEVDNVLTGKREVVHTFGWYVRTMIADVKSRGARPIVLSPTVRNAWHDGKIERGPSLYPQWARELAQEARAPFIDVSNTVADRFEALGEKKVKAFYEQDHTHFNATGADLHAAAIVAGLKALQPSPVATFLSVKGEAVTR